MPAPRRRPAARAAVLPLPSRKFELAAALPSLRSVLVGVLLFAVAVGGYFAARESSVFAVRSIEVRGASPAVRKQVVAALRDERGVSLVKIDGGLVDRRLGGVAWVASTEVDRAFPNTLVVTVRQERPVAVVRRGAAAWLVSARGRVLQELPRGARAGLPRIWVGRSASIGIGETLADADGGRAARALAPLAQVRFPARVASVQAGEDQLTFRLRSGLELRFGDTGDLRLKLAIARRILAGLGTVAAGDYVDVSVPERPVSWTNTQVEG